MTDPEIERLARECIAEDWDCGGRYYRNMDLARFAALIEAQTKERCALVCESQTEPNPQLYYEYRRSALNCADAIRAL